MSETWGKYVAGTGESDRWLKRDLVVETEGRRIWQPVSGDRNRRLGTFAKLEEQE